MDPRCVAQPFRAFIGLPIPPRAACPRLFPNSRSDWSQLPSLSPRARQSREGEGRGCGLPGNQVRRGGAGARACRRALSSAPQREGGRGRGRRRVRGRGSLQPMGRGGVGWGVGGRQGRGEGSGPIQDGGGAGEVSVCRRRRGGGEWGCVKSRGPDRTLPPSPGDTPRSETPPPPGAPPLPGSPPPPPWA